MRLSSLANFKTVPGGSASNDARISAPPYDNDVALALRINGDRHSHSVSTPQTDGINARENRKYLQNIKPISRIIIVVPDLSAAKNLLLPGQ